MAALTPRAELLLPVAPHRTPSGHAEADPEGATRVREWIDDRVARIRAAWLHRPPVRTASRDARPVALAHDIAEILISRPFNFQSRGRVRPLLPVVRHHVAQQLASEFPITLFLLYNGGYRASPLPDDPSLNFTPDQTELLLLYQVALLQQQVSAIHAPGVAFTIVVNNGVARWVNDTPLAATAQYVRRLRHMITSLGAASAVRVLVQSELPGFDPERTFQSVPPVQQLSHTEHRVVERFLGRRCSDAEARYRSALYTQAEARWAQELAEIVDATGALMLRQVAHPEMLSFRPFPGGAIRSQNGTLGFEDRDATLVPRLVTTESAAHHGIRWVPYELPWTVGDASPTPRDRGGA